MVPDVGVVMVVAPDGIGPLPIFGESPGLPEVSGGVSPEPVPEPGTATGGTGARNLSPPVLGVLPLGGLAIPPLLGGELDEGVGWAGGGVFAGVVVPGLVFLPLPPTTGARIGAEGRGMGSLRSCGLRA